MSRYEEQNPSAEEVLDTVTPEAKGPMHEIAVVRGTRCYVQEYNETDRSDLYDESCEAEVHPRQNDIIVKRYAIDPLGQHHLEGKYYDRLHPVEDTVFTEALSALDGEKVVLVDMYAKMPNTEKNRASGKVGDIHVGGDNQPEVHTIVLYKKGKDIVLLDPSNTTFSDYLAPLLSKKYDQRVLSVLVEKNKTYQAQASPGRGFREGRDCISVALAMANIIKHNPSIPEQEVVFRVSNQPKALDPMLSKRDTDKAAKRLAELPAQAARMHHSTDRDLRDPSSQFIREQALAVVQPIIQQQQEQSAHLPSSTPEEMPQTGHNTSQEGNTSKKGGGRSGRE